MFIWLLPGFYIFNILVYLLCSISCRLPHNEEQNTHFLDHSAFQHLGEKKKVSSPVTPRWSSSNHAFLASQGLHSCFCAFLGTSLFSCVIIAFFAEFFLLASNILLSLSSKQKASLSLYIPPKKAVQQLYFPISLHLHFYPTHEPTKICFSASFSCQNICQSHQWAASSVLPTMKLSLC